MSHSKFSFRKGPTASLMPLALAGLLGLGVVSGCSSEASGADAASAAPSTSASPASGTPSPTGSTEPGKGIVGFVGFDDFPMRFEAPAGFVDASEGVGTRSVAADGLSPGAVLVGSVNGTPAASLPADLAGFIAKGRPNAQVSEVRGSKVGGLPAQAFTLTQRRGTNPSDLWCARDGYCFKLLTHEPMDMTAVRTPEGLVLFTIEYLPEQRAQARAAMAQVLATVRWT